MDDLIRTIVTRTGLSAEQARQVATVTVSFLKDRLPVERAAEIDEALAKASVSEMRSGMS